MLPKRDVNYVHRLCNKTVGRFWVRGGPAGTATHFKHALSACAQEALYRERTVVPCMYKMYNTMRRLHKCSWYRTQAVKYMYRR